jgi:hypothetical protein
MNGRNDQTSADRCLEDNQLAVVAGGGGAEGAAVEALGHALWEGVTYLWDTYYEWVTRADRPPYTRA